jgi:hypothetical protein
LISTVNDEPITTRSSSSQRIEIVQEASTSERRAKRPRQGSVLAERATRSTPVAVQAPVSRALHERPAPRRSIPSPPGSHMTRSTAGPPASFLSARPKPSPLSQSFVPRKVHKSAPVRRERSASIVEIDSFEPSASQPTGPKRKTRAPPVVGLTEDEREEARLWRLARGAVDRVKVVVPIRRAHRRRLILLGHYSELLPQT